MFKNLVEEGRAAALNGLVSHPAVLKMANARLARYAELLSLNYGREGFHARARLLGSGEDTAEDGTAVLLVSHHDPALPPSVASLTYQPVAVWSFLCHDASLLS